MHVAGRLHAIRIQVALQRYSTRFAAASAVSPAAMPLRRRVGTLGNARTPPATVRLAPEVHTISVVCARTSRGRRPIAVLWVLAVAVAGCGDQAGPDRPAAAISDPGPVHVHGLGVDPADGALFVATHTGLFRAAAGEQRAQRVAGRYQDTMGFAVVGPGRFLGSGHPDLSEKLPRSSGSSNPTTPATPGNRCRCSGRSTSTSSRQTATDLRVRLGLQDPRTAFLDQLGRRPALGATRRTRAAHLPCDRPEQRA